MNSTSVSMSEPASRASAPILSIHPVRGFIALLKRELWQHRGTLLYTPMIVAGIVVIVSLLGLITGENFQVKLGGQNTAAPQALIALVGNESLLPKRVIFFNSLFFGTFTLFHVCLSIVVLLYCLGALYEERKDRSVLFWKSMPVSDTRTVLSKLATATITAPLIMLAVLLVSYLLLLCVLSIATWRYGGSAWDVVWRAASPLSMISRASWFEVVNALWMMPILGWLLFCSSFSKVRPFLWAFMVPFWIIVLGKWISSTSFSRMGLDTLADWLLARITTGVVPIGPNGRFDDSRARQLVNMDLSHLNGALTSPQLWVGVVIGAGLIAAAIYWRRYRDDSI